MKAVSALRLIWVVLACAALGLPFALIASTARGAVEPLSRVAVDVLLRVTAPLQSSAPAPLPVEPLVLEQPSATETMLTATSPGPAARKGQARRAAAPGALFVSAAKVLQLAQSTARPKGVFVSATAAHPAGLRLSGVAPLAIGVQDGDILLDALGVPAQSPGQIIGAVVEARAKQARYLSGTLWRRGHTFRITVEQPY